MSAISVTPETLPAGTWAVDPVHSHVGFAVDYLVGTFRGSFSPVEAKLEVGEDGQARLTGLAPVGSIKVQDENLTTHLLAPDFFDAERAPEISFRSTGIRRQASELEVEGELTIKGITQPVTLRGTVGEPTDDPYGGVRVGLTLETVIDRSGFGIAWNHPLPSGEPALANDVTLTAELALVRES